MCVVAETQKAIAMLPVITVKILLNNNWASGQIKKRQYICMQCSVRLEKNEHKSQHAV